MAYQFKAGDRVRYTGKSHVYKNPKLLGRLGTVQGIAHDSLPQVRFDSEPNTHMGVWPENLELVPPSTGKGDPVERDRLQEALADLIRARREADQASKSHREATQRVAGAQVKFNRALESAVKEN